MSRLCLHVLVIIWLLLSVALSHCRKTADLLCCAVLCNVTCAGFYFRQKTYPEVERVLDTFKRDPNYKKKQRADGMGQQRMPPGEICVGAGGQLLRGVCAEATG